MTISTYCFFLLIASMAAVVVATIACLVCDTESPELTGFVTGCIVHVTGTVAGVAVLFITA